MISDLHVHTNFCDGKNSPEEMVLSAIKKGVNRLGLVCHAQMPFRVDWAIRKENIELLKQEVARLKEKYKDRIEVLLGTELDYFSDIDTTDFDYTIGSVHYFYKDGKYSAIDHSEEIFLNSVKTLFDGDFYSACENYYQILSGYATKFKPDIIGHFDLVRKFNKGGRLFDENHPRYVKAMESAINTLLTLGVPFEINTGAISRGYRLEPYPHLDIYRIIKANGGKFVLSSDSHNAKNIAYQFDIWQKLL
jgi:histidinol-phosphatase (PHP family)